MCRRNVKTHWNQIVPTLRQVRPNKRIAKKDLEVMEDRFFSRKNKNCFFPNSILGLKRFLLKLSYFILYSLGQKHLVKAKALKNVPTLNRKSVISLFQTLFLRLEISRMALFIFAN